MVFGAVMGKKKKKTAGGGGGAAGGGGIGAASGANKLPPNAITSYVAMGISTQ